MKNLLLILIAVDVIGLRLNLFGASINFSYYILAAFLLIAILLTASMKVRIHRDIRYRNLILLPYILVVLGCAVPAFILYPDSVAGKSYTIILFGWMLCLYFSTRTVDLSPGIVIDVYIHTIGFLLLISLIAFFIGGGGVRLDSVFGKSTNRIALFGVIGLMVGGYLLYYNYKGRRYTYTVIAAVSMGAVILTLSRSALLALLVCALENSIRNKTIKIKHVIGGIFTLVLVVFYLHYSYLNSGDERYVVMLDKFGVAEYFGYRVDDRLEVLRQVHYESAMSRLFEGGVTTIFGTGLEEYVSDEFLVNSRGEAITLHSMYLQYLVGGGVFTFASLSVYLFGLYYLSLKYLSRFRKDLIMFIYIPSLVHAGFQGTIASREIFLIVPLVLFYCLLENYRRASR